MTLPLVPAPATGPSPARRTKLARRIRLLVAATITYNVIEAVIAISAGAAAGSTPRPASVSRHAA